MAVVIEPKFYPGDVVRLNSGSPKMTVVAVSGAAVLCAWFVDKLSNRETFNADALMIDEKGSKQ